MGERLPGTWSRRLRLGPCAATMHFASGPQQQVQTLEVKIDNFSFGPAELTVPVGTTVTWTNRDDIPHTVVSIDKLFKSKVLDTDEKFSFTFSNDRQSRGAVRGR